MARQEKTEGWGLAVDGGIPCRSGMKEGLRRKAKGVRLTEALLQSLDAETVAADEFHPMEGRGRRASMGWKKRQPAQLNIVVHDVWLKRFFINGHCEFSIPARIAT